MSWSKKQKKSVDCSNPRGFSQKAHCAGRKARQSGQKTKSKSVSEMKLSELKESIRTIIRERSVKAIQKEYSSVIADIEKHLDLYKKSKGTPDEKKHIGHLKTLGQKKKSLVKELDSAVAGLYKNAELKVDESINEACWEGYKAVGGKMKNGRMVPNCVKEATSVNEATEPEIINQLRGIVKNKQSEVLKDPKSGKKIRVDMQSANTTLKIYDGLSSSNKATMVKMGLPKMMDVAFKISSKYKK